MKEEYPKLLADDDGVWCMTKPDSRFGIRWDEIFGVVGYKMDCVIDVQTIVELEFEWGEFIELNSEWNGFQDVIGAMTARMPFLGMDWFSRIKNLVLHDGAEIIWRKSS